MRMMMEQLRPYKKLKSGIWHECASAMTKLENITVKPHEDKCDYDKFYGNMPGKKSTSELLGEWESYAVLSP